MMRWGLAYLATLVTICVLDFAWLGFVAKDFYRGQIGAPLLDRPRWAAAGLFYAMYAAGTLGFVVVPAHDAGTWTRALVHGALFGLVCYATYDLSNLATLKGWTVPMTAADIVWGMAVTACAAIAGYAALRGAS